MSFEITIRSITSTWKHYTLYYFFQFLDYSATLLKSRRLEQCIFYHAVSLWVNLSGLLLHIFDTPEYCDVIKILSHTSITWSLNTVLWWRRNILKYQKYTELFHQRATHSYLIVCCSTAFTVVEWLLSWI